MDISPPGNLQGPREPWGGVGSVAHLRTPTPALQAPRPPALPHEALSQEVRPQEVPPQGRRVPPLGTPHSSSMAHWGEAHTMVRRRLQTRPGVWVRVWRGGVGGMGVRTSPHPAPSTQHTHYDLSLTRSSPYTILHSSERTLPHTSFPLYELTLIRTYPNTNLPLYELDLIRTPPKTQQGMKTARQNTDI